MLTFLFFLICSNVVENSSDDLYATGGDTTGLSGLDYEKSEGDSVVEFFEDSDKCKSPVGRNAFFLLSPFYCGSFLSSGRKFSSKNLNVREFCISNALCGCDFTYNVFLCKYLFVTVGGGLKRVHANVKGIFKKEDVKSILKGITGEKRKKAKKEEEDKIKKREEEINYVSEEGFEELSFLEFDVIVGIRFVSNATNFNRSWFVFLTFELGNYLSYKFMINDSSYLDSCVKLDGRLLGNLEVGYGPIGLFFFGDLKQFIGSSDGNSGFFFYGAGLKINLFF